MSTGLTTKENEVFSHRIEAEMKKDWSDVEEFRVLHGPMKSNSGDTFGAFLIPYQSYTLNIIATDGVGIFPQWEHVSVSLQNRCPNWAEMSFVKDLFWDDGETVIQFHPSKAQYINQHPYCLHLWKNPMESISLPPKMFVGGGLRFGKIAGNRNIKRKS